MTRALIYARFSPRPHAQTCESIDLQLEACRAWCEERGYDVDGEYHESAVSGRDGLCRERLSVSLDRRTRPGLAACLDALQKGMVLVVHRDDRLGRSVALADLIRHHIIKLKASLDIVCGPQYDETAEGDFMWTMKNAANEYSAAVTSARTSEARGRKVRRGQYPGGRAPYGWTIKGKRLVPDEREQRARALILTMHERGMTPNRIADRLTNFGVRARGARWYQASVQKIVTADVLPELDPVSA